MKEHILTAVRTTLVLLVLVSGVYPAVVWAVGQAAFRDRANGSLLVRGGRTIGSSLIGQPFTSERYFHPRPSAVDYNAQASGGSNLGPTSQKLRDRRGAARRGLPADAITASASGLDPHISPEYAALQAARVARARGIAETRVQALVARHTEGRFLGVYGEPRVNVLLLNLALDEMPHAHAPSGPR
jgi:K+-transporting ATPase ATPase C chain